MDSVYHVKELDALNKMMRKGKLFINPRHLLVDVTCEIERGQNSYTLGLNEKLDEEDAHSWEQDSLKLKNAIYSGFSKKQFKLDWKSLNISIRRMRGEGLGQRYGSDSICLLDWKQTRLEKPVKDEDGEDTYYAYKYDSHYNIRLEKIISQEELAFMGTKHKPGEHTPKEICQFLRVLRKRIRRLMLDGKLKGALNRCDRMKEHKDHKEIMTDMVTRTQAISAAVVQLKGMADEMGQKLTPFIKVSPYDGMRSTLSSIENDIESILSNVEDLEVTAGVRTKEEED